MFWKFFRETEKKKIDLITEKAPDHFLKKKNVEEKELDQQIVKVSGKKTETTDNKIHNVFFQGLEKKKYKSEYNRLY